MEDTLTSVNAAKLAGAFIFASSVTLARDGLALGLARGRLYAMDEVAEFVSPQDKRSAEALG